MEKINKRIYYGKWRVCAVLGYERNFLPRKRSKIREIMSREEVAGVLRGDLEQLQRTPHREGA